MPNSVVALIAASAATIIAVIVPWMTFRFTLRQDQARWLREQRAQLYIDLLTEAHAERQYLIYAIAADEARERTRQHYTDLRLPPLERARLGARGTIYGSKTVNQLFNRLEGEGLIATLRPQMDMGQQTVVIVQIDGTMEELNAAIRRELGADRIPLGYGRQATRPAPQPTPDGSHQT